MDLQYPAAKDRLTLQTPGSPSAAAAQPSPPRPSFAALLTAALRPESEMRAWVNPELGYQQVLQMRLPLSLPQACPHVLASLHDASYNILSYSKDPSTG